MFENWKDVFEIRRWRLYRFIHRHFQVFDRDFLLGKEAKAKQP